VNVYADLVRLPAVLSAPGDVLLGAATDGRAQGARQIATAVTSSAFAYMAGMALNDYADREIDAAERPRRPIPSGRISPGRALAVGTALLAADLTVAWIGSGRRGVMSSLATGTALLTYDFVAKDTSAGPWVMAACRFLDVQRGSTSFRAALWPAGVVAAHTYVITRVSRDEVNGGDGRVALVSAAATGAIAAGVVAGAVCGSWKASAALGGGGGASVVEVGGRSRLGEETARVLLTTLAAGLYAVPSLRASIAAALDPSPKRLQRVVGTGVMGMIPLQGALTAAAGRPAIGAGLLALWQAGRALAVRRRVT
jgi:4-hydroxybenzoate polyprenyltransferase